MLHKKLEDGTYDYSFGASDSTVMIVRDGNTYGAAPAGSRVLVATSDLKDRGLHRACITEEEYEKLEAEKRKRAEARKPKKGTLVGPVEAAIAAIQPRKTKGADPEAQVAAPAPAAPAAEEKPAKTSLAAKLSKARAEKKQEEKPAIAPSEGGDADLGGEDE